MNKQFYKDAFGWGFVLWLIGYILGIIFFMFIPPPVIGWAIMPIGIIATLWVLIKKVKGVSFQYYLFLAAIWTIIAVVFDYFFIVKAFKSVEYYKLDVYFYYVTTFLLPVIVGWNKSKK